MKVLNFIAQLLIIAAVAAGFYFIKLPTVTVTPFRVIVLALSFAFMWVEGLHWGVTKPFNCLKCMTAWFALIIGCLAYGWWGFIFFPVGLFAGAIFSAVKMRYL